VDGAVNRITQVSALGDVRFAFTVRVDRANLAKASARIRALAELAELPLEIHPAAGVHRVDGPLTAETLKTLPEGTQALSVEDFTKFFLDPSELTRALERYRITVRRAFELLCFAITLRDVSRSEFLLAAGPRAGARLLFNPYEVGSGEARP